MWTKNSNEGSEFYQELVGYGSLNGELIFPYVENNAGTTLYCLFLNAASNQFVVRDEEVTGTMNDWISSTLYQIEPNVQLQKLGNFGDEGLTSKAEILTAILALFNSYPNGLFVRNNGVANLLVDGLGRLVVFGRDNNNNALPIVKDSTTYRFATNEEISTSANDWGLMYTESNLNSGSNTFTFNNVEYTLVAASTPAAGVTLTISPEPSNT